MKFFIDLGHGGKDGGATKNGLMEKFLNLAIGLKIGRMLENYEGVEIKYSRDDDRFLTLDQRTEMANKWGSDFFLSIHINAGGGEGFESFIYPSVTDKTVAIQNVLHGEIVKATGFKDRGKKRQNFHVLRESKMSALLTENGFIDNVNDSIKLRKEEFIDKIALGHVRGLEKAFGLKLKKSTNPTEKLYRVQVGAFKEMENAIKLVDKLKELEIDAIIV